MSKQKITFHGITPRANPKPTIETGDVIVFRSETAARLPSPDHRISTTLKPNRPYLVYLTGDNLRPSPGLPDATGNIYLLDFARKTPKRFVVEADDIGEYDLYDGHIELSPKAGS